MFLFSCLRPLSSGLLLAATLLVVSHPAHAREVERKDQAAPVTDYLNVPGPLRFDGEDFALAWSQLGQTSIKHEYVPAGQNPEHYRSMMIVDAQLSAAKPAEMAGTMIKLLNERKASDPLANYDILRKADNDEVILDFIMSSSQPGGDAVIEWNAYRYFTVREGVLGTLAISRRGYGNAEALEAFLKSLKEQRTRDIDTLAQMPLPELEVPEAVPVAPQP